MFDIGWPELLVIAIVLIIVVGPKDLPPMLRAFGRTTKKIRAMASEFRGQFDEALREADLDDVKKTFNDARKLNPMQSIRDAVSPLKDTAKDIRSDLEKSVNSPPLAGDSDPKVVIPDPAMKLSDGPPEVKQPEALSEPGAKPGKAAPATASRPTASKAATPAKKPAAKTEASKSAAKLPDKPSGAARAKPAAKPAAAPKAASKEKAGAKPAAAKAASPAKKPKSGEGSA